jgi:hypothetical protein
MQQELAPLAGVRGLRHAEEAARIAVILCEDTGIEVEVLFVERMGAESPWPVALPPSALLIIHKVEKKSNRMNGVKTE